MGLSSPAEEHGRYQYACLAGDAGHRWVRNRSNAGTTKDVRNTNGGL